MATSVEIQNAYLRLWAIDINAEVEEELSPKAQFTKFAVHVLAWKGGDGNWNRRWKECFGEAYPRYTSRAHITVTAAAPSTAPSSPSTTTSESSSSRDSDIEDETRPSWTEMEGDDFTSRFQQLSLQNGWSREEARFYRTEAVDEDIFSNYGTDATVLEAWQRLCNDVGIAPTPRSITQCKKALKKVLVNLVDLVDYRHYNTPVRRFSSLTEFRRYTRSTGKIYSKKDAKREGFIKILLREVYSTRKPMHAPVGGAA